MRRIHNKFVDISREDREKISLNNSIGSNSNLVLFFEYYDD